MKRSCISPVYKSILTENYSPFALTETSFYKKRSNTNKTKQNYPLKAITNKLNIIWNGYF